MTDKKTPDSDKKRPLRQRLKYPFALLVLTLLALLLYQIFAPHLPRVGKGEPLHHAPKAEITVLDELDDIELSTEVEVVDITNTLQPEAGQHTPFPQREIRPTEVSAPPATIMESVSPTANPRAKPDMLETAELLQTTLALAKQHSKQQVVGAKFHTLMGLVFNPTLSATEQQAWAKLTLPLAAEIGATKLVNALTALSNEQHESNETADAISSTLPTWLAPFEKLVTVRRVGTAAPAEARHTDNLAALRAAYQHYLMNESN